MGDSSTIDIMRSALTAVMTASAPPLIAGLVVGIVASIFQTVTSIQEPTLAFIPKIIAVMVALIIFGSFMASVLQEFTLEIFGRIPNIINS
ncbi:MAG: flagellar biosynthesis protein FliQ [Clostridiales bacterium]|nr:flagellar biosynthesis protein FliQ [Clostridiales bacterium]